MPRGTVFINETFRASLAVSLCHFGLFAQARGIQDNPACALSLNAERASIRRATLEIRLVPFILE